MVANINLTTQKQCNNFIHACELETHAVYVHVFRYMKEKLFVNLKTMLMLLLFVYKAELITLFIFFALIMYICYVIRGRHSTHHDNKATATSSSQININIGGCEEKSTTNSTHTIVASRSFETNVIKDIQNYNDKNDIDTWFTVFENLMKGVEKQLWARILLNKFGTRHFDKVDNLSCIIEKENAYEILKSKLCEIFGRTKYDSQIQNASFSSLIMRKQQSNEPVIAYGKDLKKLIKDIMPNIDWSVHNEPINQLFIQNLCPGEVQKAVNYSYVRAKAKNKYMTIDELIKEANTEEQHIDGMLALQSNDRMILAITANENNTKNEPYSSRLRSRENINYNESRKKSKESSTRPTCRESYTDNNAQLPTNNNNTNVVQNNAIEQRNKTLNSMASMDVHNKATLPNNKTNQMVNTSTPIQPNKPLFQFETATTSRNDNINKVINNQLSKINQPLKDNTQINAYQIGESEPIEGKAIFNNLIVNYLCDNGTGRTLINENVFIKLKSDDNTISLEPYSGPRLKSATHYLIVFGELKLKKCILGGDQSLNNVTVLVTNQSSKYDCLLGMDLTLI
jgi:hypothetical protein